MYACLARLRGLCTTPHSACRDNGLELPKMHSTTGCSGPHFCCCHCRCPCPCRHCCLTRDRSARASAATAARRATGRRSAQTTQTHSREQRALSSAQTTSSSAAAARWHAARMQPRLSLTCITFALRPSARARSSRSRLPTDPQRLVSLQQPEQQQGVGSDVIPLLQACFEAQPKVHSRVFLSGARLWCAWLCELHARARSYGHSCEQSSMHVLPSSGS